MVPRQERYGGRTPWREAAGVRRGPRDKDTPSEPHSSHAPSPDSKSAMASPCPPTHETLGDTLDLHGHRMNRLSAAAGEGT